MAVSVCRCLVDFRATFTPSQQLSTASRHTPAVRHTHVVKADECHEQPHISLSQLIAHQVAAAAQDGLTAVKSIKQLPGLLDKCVVGQVCVGGDRWRQECGRKEVLRAREERAGESGGSCTKHIIKSSSDVIAVCLGNATSNNHC